MKVLRADFVEALEAALRGVPDEAQRDLLDTAVRDDPECRKIYEEQMEQDILLRVSYLKEMPGKPRSAPADCARPAALSTTGQAGAGDAAVNSRPRTGWRRAARFVKLTSAAAVLALAVAGLWLAPGDGRRATGDERSYKEVPLVASRQSPVEILHHWGSCNLEVPEQLPGTMRMTNGRIKARLASGIELILLGPFEMELKTPKEARLVFGRMLADIPWERGGFTLRTPDLEMWDNGAVFCASVTDEGSDVFIFAGEAQVVEACGEPVDICRDGEGVRARRDGSGAVKVAADWTEADQMLAAINRRGALQDPEMALQAAVSISDVWAERWLPKVVGPPPQRSGIEDDGQTTSAGKSRVSAKAIVLSPKRLEKSSMKGMKKMAVAVAAAFFGLGNGLAEQWTAGDSPIINNGETVTIWAAQPDIVRFIDNGTLVIDNGGSVTVTGTVVTTVGSGVGEIGVLNLSGGNLTKTAGGYIVLGHLGGTGTLSIESGSTLTTTIGNLRIAGNEEGQRELLSHGEATVSGYLNVNILEFTGYFPTNLTPPYAEYARLTLNDGGVVEANQINKNDCAASVFLFNGGTLRTKSTNMDFVLGKGVMDMVIADGKNAVFDTNGKDVRINSQAEPHATVLTLRGETGEGAIGNGGLVKTGAGTLVLRLAEACNTFTGAVSVLEGSLDLGRPLAENQTVTVSAGATFIPRTSADLSKIIYLGGESDRMLYTVAADTGELNLTAINTMYYDDRIGGPFTGSVLLSNTLTHAAGTLGSPFRLIGQGGALNLTNTTLESKVLQVEGAGTFNFLGNRTFTAADDGKLVITDGGYRQEQVFSLSDANSGTPAT
ncbi:MAG: hypothetical protein PHU80_05585, partial [Kiritimatiellae bacterium]|nr:hypothetical protein [Kiritimatiellia bacterium]